MHVDPWRMVHEWTWCQFWTAVKYLKARAEDEQRAIRKARVSAGLEKPKLVDMIREQGIL